MNGDSGFFWFLVICGIAYLVARYFENEKNKKKVSRIVAQMPDLSMVDTRWVSLYPISPKDQEAIRQNRNALYFLAMRDMTRNYLDPPTNTEAFELIEKTCSVWDKKCFYLGFELFEKQGDIDAIAINIFTISIPVLDASVGWIILMLLGSKFTQGQAREMAKQLGGGFLSSGTNSFLVGLHRFSETNGIRVSIDERRLQVAIINSRMGEKYIMSKLEEKLGRRI